MDGNNDYGDLPNVHTLRASIHAVIFGRSHVDLVSIIVVCPDVDSWMSERYHLASRLCRGTCWMYLLANGNLEMVAKRACWPCSGPPHKHRMFNSGVNIMGFQERSLLFICSEFCLKEFLEFKASSRVCRS